MNKIDWKSNEGYFCPPLCPLPPCGRGDWKGLSRRAGGEIGSDHSRRVGGEIGNDPSRLAGKKISSGSSCKQEWKFEVIPLTKRERSQCNICYEMGLRKHKREKDFFRKVKGKMVTGKIFPNSLTLCRDKNAAIKAFQYGGKNDHFPFYAEQFLAVSFDTNVIFVSYSHRLF